MDRPVEQVEALGAVDTPSSPQGVLLRPLLWNVCFAGLALVVFSIWLKRYTDEFDALAPLLGLGGVLSGLPLVAKAIPKSMMDGIQDRIAEVFARRETRHAIYAIAALLAVRTLVIGSVRVDIVDGKPTYAHLYRQGDDFGEPTKIAVGAGHLTDLAVPLFGRDYRLKVPGYPSKGITLYPWSLTSLYVPKDFRRTIVLVRSAPRLGLLHNPVRVTLDLLVTRDGQPDMKQTTVFDGVPFWLNCSGDVEVPDGFKNRITTAFGDSTDQSKASKIWFPPKALDAWKDLDLSPNNQIRIMARAGTIPVKVIDQSVNGVCQSGSCIEEVVLDSPSPRL